ncbi:GNAT family N-acetyltransferase [Litorivivens sp.]|uniref:GNAT family N-acetyltransferase n=2 Tax=Litorivivens sp. TaxID=2020868 RepID=UPI0035650FEF
MTNGLQTISPGEHRLAGDIIAAGFSDDPVNCWTFRNPAALRPVYTEMARALYLRVGFGHRCADKAASLWLPPGVHKHFGLRSTLTMARHILGKGGVRAARNALLIDQAMERKHPTSDHYYLFAIAARPEHQGKGYGGALMAKALERIDAQQQPAYLENSKPENTSFYRRFGFDIVEELRVADDAPPLLLMWRPAQS